MNSNTKYQECLKKAKRLREEADYYGEFSQDNAQDLLYKTEEFLQKTRDILKTK